MQSSERSISKMLVFSSFIIADFFSGVGFMIVLRRNRRPAKLS